ncbi:IclR family transcriptional regulator [Pigmentiphaga kullae]|uniref:IclR family transcriptional regulator n=1 Tax=Pigmentiphaga kullae TaxID=151784 RepID=A0A4Q7NN92_9BURK|nr:helix-turn-helix domain-containing protein [Pigmentiphaga kullae]RZS86613.1 IclR family transcriptional regulator [Pigmentiphaga kullae]
MIARTADRALLIFETFAERLEPLTLSELSRAVQMPISTTAKLIKTLIARGYLYEVNCRKAYYPTSRWLQKAKLISSADRTVERFQPFLQELRDETGETALLAKRLGVQIIYLGISESAKDIRYSGQVGDIKEFWRTASGPAMLAAMPLVARLETIARLNERQKMLASASDGSILASVNEGLTRKWWLRRGEGASDVMSISSTIEMDDPLAFVVVGPVSRIEPRLNEMVKTLLRVCAGADRMF